MFLGDRKRRRYRGGGRQRRRGAGGQPGAGSAVPRAARTERPAAARSRTAPHRATQRRTWPGCELELKGPTGAGAGEARASRHRHAGRLVGSPDLGPHPIRKTPPSLAEPSLLTRTSRRAQLGAAGAGTQGAEVAERSGGAPDNIMK